MTTWPLRLPIRTRITTAFAAVMTVLLVGLGFIAYESMASALLDEIDSGLRFRAAALLAARQGEDVQLPDPRLEEPGEAFAQLISRDGQVVVASSGFETSLLGADELARVRQPTFFQRPVHGVVGTARLLAVPRDASAASAVYVVGTTMSDRTDALHRLRQVFLFGGAGAVALASLAGWLVAGLAMRPVERMRSQASAITSSGMDRRLTVPAARDEIHRLANTLNDMLERLDRSLTREREFLERASHELRTPLAALRAEADLGLSRTRSTDELEAALRSVSQETDRLSRLAEDLLVLARADNGRLPLRREAVPLRATLESAAALFAARAEEAGVRLSVDAPDAEINADPLRLRQLLVNLVDNALRYTPPGGAVRVSADLGDAAVRIVVSDTGTGFADVSAREGDGAHGLGLRIVRSIAESHQGSVHIGRSDDGGAAVTLELPRSTDLDG